MSFLKFIICLIGMLWGSKILACLSPITEHVGQAIKLNQIRQEQYKKHFGPEAEKIFKRLILTEQMMLPSSWYYDFRAKKFLCAGVPLFAADLVDMSVTPIFSNQLVFLQGEEKVFSTQQIVQLSKELLKKVSKSREDTSQLRSLISNLYMQLQQMEGNKHTNCLVRHFLESTHYGLLHLSGHRQKALQAKLPDPLGLGLDFAATQIRALVLMNTLDKMAYPLQVKGIPLFCQDIPPIPLTP